MVVLFIYLLETSNTLKRHLIQFLELIPYYTSIASIREQRYYWVILNQVENMCYYYYYFHCLYFIHRVSFTCTIWPHLSSKINTVRNPVLTEPVHLSCSAKFAISSPSATAVYTLNPQLSLLHPIWMYNLSIILIKLIQI